MKILLLAILVFCTLSLPARAQAPPPPAAEGEVLSEPICFDVINRAPYQVLGTFTTNYYMTPQGIRARHRANFRLKKDEKTNFCSLGPFYDGRKLDLSLRTLVPIFSCRTAIDGPIEITGRLLPDGTTADTKAACRGQ